MLRRLLRGTIRTSREVKEFHDHEVHLTLYDVKHRTGEMPDPLEVEAERLAGEIMDYLSFLEPAVKHHHLYGNGCVHMEVGLYSDQQHELDEFARRLGFRSWKTAVIVYYALKMEEQKCKRD